MSDTVSSTDIIKADVAQAIVKLRSSSQLARRGLRDAGFWPKIEELLARIDVLFMSGQYSETIALSDEVLNMDTFNFIALYYRAISHEFLLHYEAALTDLENALKIEPYNSALIAHKGVCLVLSGDKDGESWLDRALDIDQQSIAALYYKAQLSISEEEALMWWNRLVEARPRDRALLLGRAEALVALGNYRDAIADYEKALAGDVAASDTPALMKLSECYSRVGRHEDAQRTYRKILQFEPSNLYALRALERSK